MTTLMATLALGVLINSLYVALVYIVIMGISSGSFMIVHSTIWAYYYGRHGLGRVQGPAMTLSLCASAAGPLPLAMFRDFTGTYTLGMIAMMALPVLSLAVIFFTRRGQTAQPE